MPTSSVPPPPIPPLTRFEDVGWERLRSTVLSLEKTSARLKRRIRKDSFWKSVAEVGGLHYTFFSTGYLTRLGMSVLFFLCSGYLNSLSSAAAGYRTPNVRMIGLDGSTSNSETLPDLGHDLVTMATRRIVGTDYVDFYEVRISSFIQPNRYPSYIHTFTSFRICSYRSSCL